MSSPKIPTPAAPAPVQPLEQLKQIQRETANSRDQALRRMVARASLASTNVTGGMGLSGPVSTTKTLLGQ
jgi:hypothetical protein